MAELPHPCYRASHDVVAQPDRQVGLSLALLGLLAACGTTGDGADRSILRRRASATTRSGRPTRSRAAGTGPNTIRATLGSAPPPGTAPTSTACRRPMARCSTRSRSPRRIPTLPLPSIVRVTNLENGTQHRGSGQRPRTVHRRPADRPLPGGGAQARLREPGTRAVRVEFRRPGRCRRHTAGARPSAQAARPRHRRRRPPIQRRCRKARGPGGGTTVAGRAALPGPQCPPSLLRPAAVRPDRRVRRDRPGAARRWRPSRIWRAVQVEPAFAGDTRRGSGPRSGRWPIRPPPTACCARRWRWAITDALLVPAPRHGRCRPASC